MLKKRKVHIENDISTDEKNKETISNQIVILTEKLKEIEQRQHVKKAALIKIDDALTQSEIGRFIQELLCNKLLIHCIFIFRLLKDNR